MLRRYNQDHALAMTCDGSGNVLEVLHDARGFFRKGQDADIKGLITNETHQEFQGFLSDVQAHGHSMRKELILTKDGREFAFSIFGVAKNGRFWLLAVQSPKHIFLIYDEFMAMINEQGRSLREEQKKSSRDRCRTKAEDKGLLEDFMRLNNELANMQRELSIAHQSLQAQEKRFRDLVTFNPDAQIVLDDHGRILFFNPAAERILGLSESEAMGSVFALDLRVENEFCLKSSTKRICVEVRQTNVNWEGETATLFSLRDISERKQMDQIKDDIGRILQHDLITPLNPIVSLPQLLMDDVNITEDQRRILGMISKAGLRMLNMIRLSLNLYKMENGSFEFTAEHVDLVSTFRDILDDLSNRVRARKVFVRILVNGQAALPRDVFWALAEPHLCYSMFSNLVLNAIEASSAGDLVIINMSHNGRARTAIHNSAPVPQDIRETFFEKYVTFGKTHGTGLGTYSARLIAQTLGGYIRMETSDQEGTTVSVELPAANGEYPCQTERLHTGCYPEPIPVRDPEPFFHEPEVRQILEELEQEIGLHSFRALALADKLLQHSSPEAYEWPAFERIVHALGSFDFASASTALHRAMKNDSQDGTHEG